MTCNYSTIKVEGKEIEYKILNITSYIIGLSTILYHTYHLLYCTGHIQMINNYSTIYVKKKQ